MNKPNGKMGLMYEIIIDRLRIQKDFYGMINIREIKLCLCRLFHIPKQETNRIIKELEAFGLLEMMGRNDNAGGVFYKVN